MAGFSLEEFASSPQSACCGQPVMVSLRTVGIRCYHIVLYLVLLHAHLPEQASVLKSLACCL